MDRFRNAKGGQISKDFCRPGAWSPLSLEKFYYSSMAILDCPLERCFAVFIYRMAANASLF